MKAIRRPRWFQLAALVVALACIACLTISTSGAEVGQAPARDQTIRVHLTRLGVSQRIDLTLLSAYGLWSEGQVTARFPAGSQIALIVQEGSIYLYYQDMSLKAGQNVELKRYEGAGAGGFYVTNFPALYEGDLRLDIVEGALRPVLSLHVEDYLKGVVPYEMSESFPLEALKAQAVAARTYALRSQDPDAAYDVVDTTNDQVFRGYIAGYDLVEEAIQQTRGVCGFYKGELAQCYYSASNGGQTERVETVWPTSEDFSYYAFGEDPYDLANPASPVRSFDLPKTYAQGEQAPYALRKLLSEALADTLTSQGLDASPESVEVREVKAVWVDTPVGGENSKWMTRLHMTLSLAGRTRAEGGQAADPDTEEVSLFLVTQTASPSPAAIPEVTAALEAIPQPTYGPFVSIGEEITVDVDIFPTAEDAFGMNLLNNYDNEIWTVVETEDAFVLQARRYGHGLGMSQRGAQWMAAAYQMTYEEILAFYYPGMNLMQYPEQASVLLLDEGALSATAGPAPTPTPRPTLMPVTQEAQEGQWFALVTEIDDDSSLNLRAEPSLSADVLMRLYKNQRLLVLGRCEEEGWVQVRTDAAEGYVMESYLTKEP